MQYRDFERAMARLLDPLMRRVLGLAARATLLAAEDRAPVASMQVNIGSADNADILDRVEYLQQFGFSSRPHPGARCLVISLGGERGHSVVVLADDRQRQPKPLGPGESMQFDALGKFLHMRADGSVHFKAPKLVIDVDELVLLCSQRYRRDVHGLADERRHEGGSDYTDEAWITGATITAAPSNPVAPPASEPAPE